MATIEELTQAVAEAESALADLLPTEDESDIAGLRVMENGVAVDDTEAQATMFGDRAAALRASLAAKEAASPAARLALRIAQRELSAALAAQQDA